MDAATYVRLSASRLGDEAPGLARQREATARLVRERGWDLKAELSDADVSAFSGAARPGMDELRALVAAGEVGAVVFWSTSRAFRNLLDAAGFMELCRERGVAIVSQSEGVDTTGPFGPVLFALFASLAQMESQTRSDRITAWHLGRAKAGEPAGGGTRPYGFKDDRVRHEPMEVRALRSAARRILEGGSLRQEARRLGMTTTGLRRSLTSARAAGLRQHRDATYPAVWRPILAESDWLALRQLLDANQGPGNAGRRYLLTGGVATCGLCGANLVARPKADGRRCYVCATDQGGCGKIRQLAAPLEEMVAEAAMSWHQEHAPSSEQLLDRRPSQLRRSLDADVGALEELARDRYVRRVISDAEFMAARTDLAARIAEAQREMERLASGASRRSYLFNAEAEAPPWETPAGEEPEDISGWRRFVAEAVERVAVGPAVRGQNFFNADRVEITLRD